MVKAGIRQQRQRTNKIVFYVYGIVTDGLTYEFLRLDHDLCLQISKPYQTSYASERKGVEVCTFHLMRFYGTELFTDCFARYRYIDAILDAAISCSPHTTPSKSFPDHHAKRNHTIERKLFYTPALPIFPGVGRCWNH